MSSQDPARFSTKCVHLFSSPFWITYLQRSKLHRTTCRCRKMHKRRGPLSHSPGRKLPTDISTFGDGGSVHRPLYLRYIPKSSYFAPARGQGKLCDVCDTETAARYSFNLLMVSSPIHSCDERPEDRQFGLSGQAPYGRAC